MKLAIAVLAALPLTAAPPLPELRVAAAPRGSVLFVRNVHSQPLSAFLIELVDYPGSSFSHWQDDFTSGEISPGVEKAYPVTSMLVGAVSPEYVKVQAAIYADGNAVGNPEKIKQMIAWRTLRLETTRELIRRIEKSQSNGMSKANIVDDLKRWKESLGPGPGNLLVARPDIAIAIGKFDKQSVEDVLDTLKRNERALASSKPKLLAADER